MAEITCRSPQVSWLIFKAVRAGLAIATSISESIRKGASNVEMQPTGRGPKGCVKMGRRPRCLTSLLLFIHVQVPSLAPVSEIEATPAPILEDEDDDEHE